jgi:hypothetical protein
MDSDESEDSAVELLETISSEYFPNVKIQSEESN